ncbi:GOLPH3/VPS74 family protein [Marinactinospora thermotolerans]|uniref:Golgi phosphoprotein 3 (GPP34) n=1 Tax=Marinactinospora thermotolerans DSM 45154 TaxID=1122192 RepID=A0A1T4PM50_9ACTN|nr:GPP34 family phosphoprotein [Marinactinospora thermotolerans]SJZ92664.1 Golgi phosphoprotein 3 (GPP34) [Marinactinospora thermotolerans DSM 45154]
MPNSPMPMPAPPQLSLPEEFLLLSHHRHGDVHDPHQTAIGCAAAELGELALRRRLRVAPQRKGRLFGFEVYFTTGRTLGRIHLLDLAPTGLAWADGLLAELERLAASSRNGPIRLRTWLRQRGGEALRLHRRVLVERNLLFHHPGFVPGEDGHHYPDVAVRAMLVSRLRAATGERIPLDERTLLLLDLVDEAELNEDLGLSLSTRQRLDRARGVGAVTALPEDVRDTSTVLSMSIPSRKRSGAGGGDGGDGGGGE